ncbi:hypothetical protein MNBD_PLANCTO02-613, partial [hydrothermal vent metagenome]
MVFAIHRKQAQHFLGVVDWS